MLYFHLHSPAIIFWGLNILLFSFLLTTNNSAKNSQKRKTIAILTSGGDAPGMNAAIKAGVTAALANNYQVMALVYDVVDGEIIRLNTVNNEDTIRIGMLTLNR